MKLALAILVLVVICTTAMVTARSEDKPKAEPEIGALKDDAIRRCSPAGEPPVDCGQAAGLPGPGVGLLDQPPPVGTQGPALVGGPLEKVA